MGTGSSETRASQEMVSVGSIVVRCVRFEVLLAFWEAALGYVPREAPSDGWVVLTDPTGAGPNISLDPDGNRFCGVGKPTRRSHLRRRRLG